MNIFYILQWALKCTFIIFYKHIQTCMYIKKHISILHSSSCNCSSLIT